MQQALNQTNTDGSAVSDSKIKTDIQKALAPTFDRKLKEMKLAIGLEKRYSKDDILAGVPEHRRLRRQHLRRPGRVPAVLLQERGRPDARRGGERCIAIVQYPTPRDLQTHDNYAANQDRRDVILQRHVQPRATSRRPSTTRRSRPRSTQNFVHPTPTTSGCLGATRRTRFVCDYADRSISERRVARHHADERRAAFKRGGYTVVTSINPALQQTRHGASCSRRRPKDETRFQLGSAVTSVQVNTGRILVMAQNKDYNNTLEGGGCRPPTAVNFNADLAHGGSVGFQPGSTYKPYVLLAFLNSGGGLAEAFNASKLEMNQAQLQGQLRRPVGRQVQVQERLRREGVRTR